MTLKQGFKFCIVLFCAIATMQVIIFAILRVFVWHPSVMMRPQRMVEVLIVAGATSLPVFILVPSKKAKKMEITIRYVLHFAVTLGALVTVLPLFWNIYNAALAMAGGGFTLIYVVGIRSWRGYDKSIRNKWNLAIAEAESEAKSRFLAYMSHEIRTPISSVLGLAEIQLSQKKHRPEALEAFLKIYNVTTSLTDLLNSMLDLSKIQAGKMQMFAIKYDIASMVQDITQMHGAILPLKDFAFSITIDPNLPSTLIGDDLRIRQIANNLLSNSFKYTTSGQVVFQVSCTPGEAGYVNLILTIKDTGCGMTDEQIEKILNEEYVRFDEHTRPHIQGTGLGMSVVRSLLSLLGASMTIESAVGVGTTTVVTIPQQLENEKKIGRETARQLEAFKMVNTQATHTPVPMPWGRILVVDDLQTNLAVAKSLLDFYHMQVETCQDVADVYRKVGTEGNVYDIIFMDHLMPGENGVDVTRTLREMGYTEPIIALTANSSPEQVEEFLASGFDGFLAKPIKTLFLHELLMGYVLHKGVAHSGGTDVVPDNASMADRLAQNTLFALNDNLDEYFRRPEVVEMIIADYVKSYTSVVPNIKKALHNGDYASARVVAHSTRSRAILMGAQHLAHAAEAVEKLLAVDQCPTAEKLQALDTELYTVFSALNQK